MAGYTVAQFKSKSSLARVNEARLLFSLIGANMNSSGDQAFTKVGSFTQYLILSAGIRVVNASISLTTAAGGIYLGAAKTNAIVASSQAYSALTGATLGLGPTLNALGFGLMTATPILSLTTPQGGASTADFYIYGIPLSVP